MSILQRFSRPKQPSSSAGSSTATSPRIPPATPLKRALPTPVAQSTPRTVIEKNSAPSDPDTPSLSASVPFDWNAARARLPPPYASSTPTKNSRRQSTFGTPLRSNGNVPRPKIVRRRSLYERLMSLPSDISFHWEVTTAHLELFTPEQVAWAVGGFMHFLHLFIRVVQIRKIPDSDLGWEDMYREDEGEDWFDWTIPMTILLLIGAFTNAIYLFTRTRLYQLYLAPEPVSSPNAHFVSQHAPPEHHAPAQESYIQLALQYVWHALAVSVRFLLNLTPPKDKEVRTAERVQVLEKWDPQEFEMTLFCVYSPVHSALWLALTSANWIWICVIMGMASAQIRAMTRSFEMLLKDNTLIQREVMHEYDTKFVNPRIHPIRCDVGVMTNQAEVVSL